MLSPQIIGVLVPGNIPPAHVLLAELLREAMNDAREVYGPERWEAEQMEAKICQLLFDK